MAALLLYFAALVRTDRNLLFLSVRLWAVAVAFVAALIVAIALCIILPRELGVAAYRSAFYYDITVYADDGSPLDGSPMALPILVKERRLQVYFMGVWASVVIVVGLCVGGPPLIAAVRASLARRRARAPAAAAPAAPPNRPAVDPTWDEHLDDVPPRLPPPTHVFFGLIPRSYLRPPSLDVLYIGARLAVLGVMYGGAIPFLGGVWIEACLVVPTYSRGTQCVATQVGNTWLVGMFYFHIWCRLVSRHPDVFEHPWGHELNRLLENRWERLDIAVQTFSKMSVEVSLHIVFPFAVHHLLLPVLTPYVGLAQTLHHFRLSHAVCAGAVLGHSLARVVYRMAPGLADLLREHIHDDTFLLGLRLHNFDGAAKRVLTT